MHLLPTFYFRPLKEEIALSNTYQITLRNLRSEELPIFEENLHILCGNLSDKEKRRILYTLHPFGMTQSNHSIAEVFVHELAKIWIVIESKKELPFEEGLVDYGYLLGYRSDGTYVRNPAGFVIDIKNLSARQLLRALKKELPKAARLLTNLPYSDSDLQYLSQEAGAWDGLLAQTTHQKSIQLAKILRNAYLNNDIYAKFINYCIALELLVAHNPSFSQSKMPINKQFATKIALLRHIMIKSKNQNHLKTPEENQTLYKTIYEVRSQIIHGRSDTSITKTKIASYLNEIYPTLRLIIELKTKDPLFLEFIYNI
ncbi:MAG: hypothetical protein ACRCVW_01975 [Brevinema sp.]